MAFAKDTPLEQLIMRELGRDPFKTLYINEISRLTHSATPDVVVAIDSLNAAGLILTTRYRGLRRVSLSAEANMPHPSTDNLP